MYFLYFGVALVVLTLFACLYCFRVCFFAPKNRAEDPYTVLDGDQYTQLSDGILYCTRRMEESPCEFVSIRSYDGLKLSARYYHHNDNAPVLLLFHGYRGMALRDCAGGYILGKKIGFNVLAVDQRAHGRSDGCVITFGIRERLDCLSWIHYVNQRAGIDIPVVIYGLSMGAATVLMASDLELPTNLCGIMADCPYSDPKDIIMKVASDLKYPPKLVYPFIWLSARLFGGFRLTACSAKSAVANANAPVLLIHGEDDRFVPCDMSRDIAKICASRCELHTFPDAGHGLCFTSDPKRYEKIVLKFLTSLPQLQPYLEKSEYAQEVLKGTL